jgi:hypothetical protein
MEMEKKTTDMKAYQKEYKAKHKAEANNYMKEYIKKADVVLLEIVKDDFQMIEKEIWSKMTTSYEADELKSAAKKIEKEMKKSNKGHIKTPVVPYENPLDLLKDYPIVL